MAISIKHRFIDRLEPSTEFSFIKTIIIGTFNPGLPDLRLLNIEEAKEFSKIQKNKKFTRFNNVRNFYDRPQNRFWGVLDRIFYPDYYWKYGIKARNKNGLKYFSGENRYLVFKRQSDFCIKNGIYITDLVREINPETFINVYDNFPDITVEKSQLKWNTPKILDVIEKFKPKTILFNFSTENNSIPKIIAQAKIIKSKYNNISFSVKSTSGARTLDYQTLVDNWKGYF